MGGLPRLHVVSDDERLDRPDFVELAVALLSEFSGRMALHVRGPDSRGRDVMDRAARIADGVGTSGLVVNDRVDVARVVGASVHLGRRSVPAPVARSLVGPDVWVGQSTARVDHLEPEIDYAFVGPVFRTVSHPGTPGRGVEWVGDFARQTTDPIFGIGGISPDRIGVLLEAGAYGVAVIRSVWEAPDPMRAVEQLIHRLERP